MVLVVKAILVLILLPIMLMTAQSADTSSIVVGGGCFWCVEAVYDGVPGVLDVESGYAGGKVENPSYDAVCSGQTGHAEVVKISYDPALTDEEKLLELFWKAHDPTTLNRQGNDTGTQYRSIILYANDQQRDIAVASKSKAQQSFKDTIVTEVAPLTTFYPAEKYHQDFYDKNPQHPYNQAVIKPKLDKLSSERAQ
jgi:peptide-methionine (S)-S-oxide reductase